jgi:predicted ATPase
MLHLRSVQWRAPDPDLAARYPFSIPAIAALIGAKWDFTTPVTLLVGENGSGKSTMLEALAVAIGSIAVGSEDVARDATLDPVRPLADHMKLVWNHKTRQGFFLRAEDFFGYAQRMQRTQQEYLAELRRIDADTSLSRTAKGYARLPYGSEVAAMRRRYGAGLDTISHGESFLRLFQSRFVADGLYLLDEPEAPLSPMRQLALLALIKQTVAEQGAQFIIATHSPILLAAPQAAIFTLTEHGLQPIAYEDTEHVRFTRDFLNNPELYLRHL